MWAVVCFGATTWILDARFWILDWSFGPAGWAIKGPQFKNLAPGYASLEQRVATKWMPESCEQGNEYGKNPIVGRALRRQPGNHGRKAGFHNAKRNI